MAQGSRPPVLKWKDIVERGEQFHVARSEHNKGNAAAIHSHDFVELFWVDSGRGKHLLNGNSYPICEGDLWFIRAADQHGFFVEKTTSLCMTNIAFPCATLDFMRLNYFPRESRWWWESSNSGHHIFITPEIQNKLNRAADSLALAPRVRRSIHYFLLTVFSHLEKASENSIPDGTPDWLASACRSIRHPNNFREGIAAFFRLAGRCPEHTARTMKRHLGLTPSAYVTDVRLDYAAFNLRMTTKPVTEIAMNSGYDSLGQFFLMFRRKYGCSPGKYRRSLSPE